MFEARNEPRASGPLWPIVGCVLLLLVLSVDAVANDDDETLEADRWRPGLVASLIGAKGHAQHRIDTNVAFNWQAQRPDPRIDSHDFRGLWQGRLFSIVPGPYRLYVYAQGTVTVELNGAAVLNASAEKPGWLTTAPIELEYGYHPLRIAYRRTTAEGRLALYWSGPQFQLEPVPVWHLFHDVDESPNDRFAEGEALVRALRCNACHAIPSLVPPLPAPSLTKLGGHVDEPWLIEWLQSAGHTTTTTGESVESSSVPRRMPAFDLNRDEATALVAWLLTTSDRESSPTHDLQTGDAQAGESLFHTVGCLACHQVNGAGTGGLFGGGDLSRIAEKRPADFFVRWLTDPAAMNASHRMPIFALDEQERHDLSAYLATLHEARVATKETELTDRPELIARGEQLAQSYRCGSCHQLSVKNQIPAGVELDWDQSNWQQACTGNALRERQQPGFRLSSTQQDAVREYVASLVHALPQAKPRPGGHSILAERNCLNCHARGVDEGLAPVVARLAEHDERYALQLPALTPPALTGVGDKLTVQALSDAIATRNAPLRPWLALRMPRFVFSQ